MHLKHIPPLQIHDVDKPELVALIGQVFEAYVTEHHTTDIMQILLALDEDAHYSVVSNTMTLFEANMEVGDYFNAYPSEGSTSSTTPFTEPPRRCQ